MADRIIDLIVEIEKDQDKALARCVAAPEPPPMVVDDCCVCGESPNTDSLTTAGAVKQLKAQGFRVFQCDNHQVKGLMCPTCIGQAITYRLDGGDK